MDAFILWGNLFSKNVLISFFLLLFVTASFAQLAGNPIFPGDHPDPEIRIFNDKYYIYPTNEGPDNSFHAYSSSDLTNWVDEGPIFSLRRDCNWANVNGWAPSVIKRNNQYYLYYTAEAKIGCAVSNSPTGPFRDLGYPFIENDPFTVDIIDAMAFIDDDGQAYLYYGGSNGSRMVVRKLNPDMVTFASGPQDITPQGYTEAPFLIKRDGIYYMSYSNGSWFNETYNVQYSYSNSPIGPWTYGGIILSSADDKTGPGHHAIMQIPGCDDYYMVYHRYDGTNRFRSSNIDRMYFNPDGSIRKVQMTDRGVQARTPFGTPCSQGNIYSGAVYKLTHKGTNQCLDVTGNTANPGANIQQWDDNGVNGQRWVITKESDGHYKFRQKNTNQCLDVVNNSNQPGANVIQYNDNGNDAQRWMLQAMEDGYYKIIHKNTDQCLDVTENSSERGANVQQWTDNGNDAQRWKIEVVESNQLITNAVYELEPECAPGKRLDVDRGLGNNGTNVQLYERNGNIAQEWIIRGVGNGFWEIIPNAAPDKRLDVAGGQDLAGSNMHLWEANGLPAQRYRLLDQGDGYYEIEPQVAPGKRLDVANMRQDNKTNVLMWNDLSNAAQRWRFLLKNEVRTLKINKNTIQLNSIRPYPNPFDKELKFSFGSKITSPIIIEFYDSIGKNVFKIDKEPLKVSSSTFTIDGGKFINSGLYFYRIVVNESVFTGEIVKK